MVKITDDTKMDILMMTVGSLFIAAGVYFFKFPNHFSTGGVSGLSVVLASYLPAVSPGTLMFVINGVLLLIAFAVFGKGFGFRTAYVSTLMSGLTWLLERAVPMSQPLTSQPLLELIFAVTLPAVGSAILFNIDATSGGTDIVAMLLRKYTTLNIGNALLLSDSLITLAACFAFGIETGLFSILGLLIRSVLVDMVLENIKINKLFHIITTDPEPIQAYIVNTLHRGATVLHGEGAFTHENRVVLLTAVNRAQAVHLRRFIRQTEPSCFILITNTFEIIGKGFRGTN